MSEDHPLAEVATSIEIMRRLAADCSAGWFSLSEFIQCFARRVGIQGWFYNLGAVDNEVKVLWGGLPRTACGLICGLDR